MRAAAMVFIFLRLFSSSAAQNCEEFKKAYTKMRECYTIILIGSKDEICLKNRNTMEVIMSSKKKHYVTHKCQYSRTKPDTSAAQCATNLSTITVLEFVECDLTGFNIKRYAGQKTVEKIIINDRLFREINIYFDIGSAKNITYLYPSSRKPFQVKFSKAMNLEALHVHRFDLISFVSAPFVNLTKLQTLHLTYGTLTGIDDKLFQGLTELKTLDLTGNKISTVSTTAFVNTNLERIFMGENKLKRLPHNLFDDVKTIKIFDVHNNPEIYKIPKDYLKNAEKLEIFIVSHCILKFIKADSFSGAQSLRVIDLSHNELITIEAGSFAGLRSLEKFDISHNPITIFHPNDPFGVSPVLQQVIANNCNLTDMPKVDMQKHNLTRLDFSHNDITQALLPAYSKQNTEVLLNDNNIAIIKVNSAKKGYNSPKYRLANNSPRCNCHTKSFLNLLDSDKNKNIFPDAGSIFCRGSNNLKVIDAIQKKPPDCPYYCPLDCYCFGNTTECRGLQRSTLPFPLPSQTSVLHLENNRIETLNTPDPFYWDNISQLYLTNNSLRSLRDWNVPSGLIGISLDGNRLRHLPSSLMKLVDKTPGFEIFLADNDWNCDCEFIETKNWFARNQEKIRDAAISYCSLHSTERGLIRDVPADCFCGSSAVTDGVLIGIITIVILLVLAEISYYYKTTLLTWIHKAGLLQSRLPSKNPAGRIHPMEPK